MIVQAIVTILLFALLASPFMFRTVTGLTGGLVANATTGQPKPVGLIVHGLVFVVLRGLLSRTVSLYGDIQPRSVLGADFMSKSNQENRALNAGQHQDVKQQNRNQAAAFLRRSR